MSMPENNVHEILALNEITKLNGLSLTKAQAAELVVTKQKALRDTGRMDFDNSVIQKIVTIFSESAYLDKRNYPETLMKLTEIFYCFKNETEDFLSDDELISFMNKTFNKECAGSSELLEEKFLPELVKRLKEKNAHNIFETAVTEDE